MGQQVTRDEVRRLVAEGAVVVDVLPRREYQEFHIAGALNIPLAHLDHAAAARLSGERVVVYCYDFT
jgi:rhodanese-related sulfurtransferase